MSSAQTFTRQLYRSAVTVAAILFAGYAGSAFSQEVRVLLAGNQEIPQVVTPASGSGAFTSTPSAIAWCRGFRALRLAASGRIADGQYDDSRNELSNHFHCPKTVAYPPPGAWSATSYRR